MGRRFASDCEANLATKFDLSELRRDTKDDMRQVKDDMRQVGAALSGLRDEMRADRQAIEARLAADRLAAENRLAADRKEAAERLAADRLAAEARLENERREAKALRTQMTFTSVGVGVTMVGIFVAIALNFF